MPRSHTRPRDARARASRGRVWERGMAAILGTILLPRGSQNSSEEAFRQASTGKWRLWSSCTRARGTVRDF